MKSPPAAALTTRNSCLRKVTAGANVLLLPPAAISIPPSSPCPQCLTQPLHKPLLTVALIYALPRGKNGTLFRYQRSSNSIQSIVVFALKVLGSIWQYL